MNNNDGGEGEKKIGAIPVMDQLGPKWVQTFYRCRVCTMYLCIFMYAFICRCILPLLA